MSQEEYNVNDLPDKISINPEKNADANYLMEEVHFPVIVEGEDDLQTMTSTRWDCVKHKLEHGVYVPLTFRGDKPCLIMITDGYGKIIGDEKDDGEQKGGKSLIALLTGTSHMYHYLDGDVMNNVTSNFERRPNKDNKQRW